MGQTISVPGGLLAALESTTTPHYRAAGPEAEDFYAECLKILKDSAIPFMMGGTLAINAYTGMKRPTKDMDIFCKAGDFPRIIQTFSKLGYTVAVEDERWLAKVFRGDHFFDVIFNSANSMTPVTDEWFKEAERATVCEIDVTLLPPAELVWSKVFVQDRYKYDGSDVAHMILAQGSRLNWQRLMNYADQYWEVLLVHLLNFRFIYPSERELVPRWLLDELLARLQGQINLPTPRMKVCRGRLFSRADYAIDVGEWGYADVIGAPDEYTKKP